MRSGFGFSIIKISFFPCIILIIFISLLLFHTFFLSHSSPLFLSLYHLSVAYIFQFHSGIYRHCLLIWWPSELKKLLHLPSFVFSIEYSTVSSTESFLNLALLLSRLIHKFSLPGLPGFIVGYQKSSSDAHDCSWKLWALQPCLLSSDSKQSNISYPLAEEH